MKPHKALWISLTAVFGVLSIGIGVGSVIVEPYSNTITTFLKAPVYKTETIAGSTEEDTTYYKSAYANADELKAHEEELCTKVEGEGAVLLKNNGTLPLAKGSKFSCFSHSSVDPVYGGTGSGGVDTSTAVDLKTALLASFGEGTVNTKLWRYYLADCADYKRVNAKTTGGSSEDYKINEVPWANISGNSTLTDTFASFGDVALVVLARSGGEGSDLPFNSCSDGTDGDYLRLSQNEIDLLKALKGYKDAGTFKKIVVLLNYSNALQLDFLDQSDYGIDAALWIGDPGQTGMRAVAQMLIGDINPSGRLADTFLKDNQSMPSIVNFGMHDFSNPNNYAIGWEQYNTNADLGAKCNQKYHVYQEGIYVGYRYYETRYEDVVMASGNTAGWAYNDKVAFPFGYGSSYTRFEYSDFKSTEKTTSFEFTVNVKNTGTVAGKHTVQIYAQSPYTEYDKTNLVEKSAVTLVGFAKSGVIAAGESESVSVSVDKKDLASYDANAAKTYLLEGGDYYLSIGENAHDATNNILAAKGYTPTNTSARMDAEGKSDLVKKWTLSKTDNVTYSVSSETGYTITNQFDDADLNKYEGTKDQKITYVTRNNWGTSFPSKAVQLSINETMWNDGLINTEEGRKANALKTIAKHYADAVMPKFGQTGALQTVSFRGVSYDYEGWQSLIEQASYDEITAVISSAFHVTLPIGSVGLPGTLDENGPQGFTAKIVGGSSGMCYTSEDIMAATYNVAIMSDIGACIGEDFLAAQSSGSTSKYAGLYGPGVNIHRNPYCGRNFEYFSEDGLLSAKMVAPETHAIQDKGVHVFAKHFFLNDEENGRMGLSTWSNEQAIREIYSRGFEGVVDGGRGGVMTSFGRLGVTWAGGHYGAITELLRNEWGCNGAVITDCSYFCPYMDYIYGVLAGVNLWDGNVDNKSLDSWKDNAAMASMVQNSLKRILYSYSNTIAMNGLSANMRIVPITPWWKNTLKGLTIGFGVLAGLSAGMLVYTLFFLKKKEA